MIAYRADIDGLRAVAVLLVVLYHLNMPFISGGFIGVDVFFVISGFLITSIIAGQLKEGRFSLLEFYERRVRRILPALFLVMFVSTVAAWFILFPPELEYYGQSMAAASAFGSNILFWKKSGYFEMEAALVPLLHTWSLAVEEQFYIFFPLFLMAAFKFCPRFVIPLTVLGFIISFLISVAGLEFGKYAAVFYLLPPRAWELLAGSLLALGVLPALRHEKAALAMAVLGLGAILYAGLFFTHGTLFPGAAALVPVMGAAFLIYAGTHHAGAVQKMLSLRPVVATGKISYSLYLWHWPLIVFYNYASPYEMNVWSGGAILLASFALAYVSWRWVEQPLRHGFNVSRLKVFGLAVMGSVLFLAAGFALYFGKGVPQRFPDDVRKLSEASIGIPLPEVTHLGFEGNSGVLGDADAKASFVVWGDSHAQAATPALDEMAKQAGRKGYLFEDSGCMPGVRAVPFFEEACNDFNQKVLVFLKEHPDVDRVILLSYWSAYAARIDNKASEIGAFEAHMEDLFSAVSAAGKEIYVVTEVPLVPVVQVPLYLARAKYYGQEVELDIPLAQHEEKQARVISVFDSKKKTYGLNIVRPHDALCQGDTCFVTHNGRSLYYDDDHLSTYGARHIQRVYAPLFR